MAQRKQGIKQNKENLLPYEVEFALSKVIDKEIQFFKRLDVEK